MTNPARLFSYVDTTTGYLYFNIDTELPEEELEHVRLQLRFGDRRYESKLQLLRNRAETLLHGEYAHRFHHEWCHMLQMIFFPYQYVHSWKELAIVRSLRQILSRSSGEIPIGRYPFRLLSDFNEVILHPAMVTPLRQRSGGGVEIGRDPGPPYTSPYDLTLLDLLEDFASVFEYKYRIGGAGNGRDYAMWVSNPDNKAYANVFWLLAELWDEDYAYRLLPGLIQASFYTDWVFNAFIFLINWVNETGGRRTYGNSSNDQLFQILKDRLIRLGQRKLRPSQFGLLVREVADFDFSPYLSFGEPRKYQLRDMKRPDLPIVGEIESPQHPTLLSSDFMSDFVAGTNRHPLFLYATRYLELLEQNPQLETALFHPYDASVIEYLQNEFEPVLMVIRLFDPSLVGRDTMIVLGKKFINTPSPDLPSTSYRSSLDETMKRKDIAWSLVTDINDSLPHQCHHTDCPYYESNLCRRWSAIPLEYWHCAFPNWLSRVYELKIDPVSKTIKPQQEEVTVNTRTLVVEADPKLLDEFRKFLFDNSPEMARALRPIHEQGAGFEREPIIISLAVALGGPVIVREFCGLVRRYLDIVSQREAHSHQREVMRLLLEQDDRTKKSISIEQLEQLTNQPSFKWAFTQGTA